ncbi:transporter substrate-binding domain-containing protein [Lyngbya confervoides]|uniref:Transporter substrate-binding domain-containing protein n=1 Tax=Lyngbya confervoides BDU141951 TaxID=1574623 RepID=A0ABD4TBD5_9CYAN|nr:transporter substrate-binding domain-containing protein [Lyngbya confervoides]MCM1985240.1 transporter substrate-binding domain-containing protein [Lyngbya confervoides BDU141951]
MRFLFPKDSSRRFRVLAGIGAALVGLLGAVAAGEVAVEAADLETVKRRGYFIVGVKENLPLLGLRQPDGSLQGFEIDLAQALSQHILDSATPPQWVPLLNQDRLAKVMSGEVDLAIANLTPTDARRRVVEFSLPYLSSRTGFITTVPAPLRFADLARLRLGLLQGSVAIGRVRAAFPQATLVGLDTYEQAQQGLEQGTVEVFAGDELMLRGWLAPTQAPRASLTSGRLLPVGLGYDARAIALPKGLQYETLRQAVNQGLRSLEHEGRLQQMRKEWQLPPLAAASLDRLEED